MESRVNGSICGIGGFDYGVEDGLGFLEARGFEENGGFRRLLLVVRFSGFSGKMRRGFLGKVMGFGGWRGRRK